MTQHRASATGSPFSAYQKFVIGLLAFLQFTTILDFMIMSPLGALIMPALNISTAQFGFAVSAYAFSAGTVGFLTAGFADKFDRKKLLLLFYTGFVGATLFCGLAPTYPLLVAARILTGVFAGVTGSVAMAIVTDLFPLEVRGRAMGLMQTSFAASQILGLPAGLYLSALWGWHAPFLVLAAFSLIAGLLIAFRLAPVDAHLKLNPDRNVLHHFAETLRTGRYLFAFLSTALLSLGGFMLMPFMSAFLVNNVGVSMKDLPMIYMATGIAAIIAGPVIGRLSDRLGKYPVFLFGCSVTIVCVIILTNLGPTPLPWVIALNMCLFVGIFSRMIPATALSSAVPAPKSRGAFMSISASLQQLTGGVGSFVGGAIVSQGVGGRIEHFDHVGYVLVGTTMITGVMLYFIDRMVRNP